MGEDARSDIDLSLKSSRSGYFTELSVEDNDASTVVHLSDSLDMFRLSQGRVSGETDGTDFCGVELNLEDNPVKLQTLEIWSAIRDAFGVHSTENALGTLLLVMNTQEGWSECLETICDDPNGRKTTFVQSALDIINRFPNNDKITKKVFKILTTAIGKNPRLLEQLSKPQRMLRHIIKVLTNVQDSDPDVHSAALRLILCLAQNEETCKTFLLNEENKVLYHVLASMVHHSNSTDVYVVSCRLLRLLMESSTKFHDDLSKNVALDHIMTGLQKHDDDPDVLSESCKLLISVLESGSKTPGSKSHIEAKFLEEDVHKKIIQFIKGPKISTDEFVGCLGVLAKVAHIDNVQATLLQNNIHTLIYNHLVRNTQQTKNIVPGLYAHGLNVFYNMVPLLYLQKRIDDEDKWLIIIGEALLRNADNCAVQTWACRTISRLMEHSPTINQKIGEDSLEASSTFSSVGDDQDTPLKPVKITWELLHNKCILALLVNGKSSPEVFSATCDAIYWLSANNEKLRSLFLDKHTDETVVKCMRRHIGDARAQASACRVIRGFCIFCPANSENMVKQEVQGDILKALTRFNTEAEVQIEAIAAITCLTDLDFIRHECLLKHVEKKILQAMKLHLNNEVLIEVALEALASFAGSAGGVTILNDSRAISKVLMAMENHPASSLIQKKGLVLLALLPEKEMRIKSTYAKRIVNVIKRAMTTYEDSDSIQIECCAAIQILAEKNPSVETTKYKLNKSSSASSAEFVDTQGSEEISFSELFIREDIHLLLFNLMESRIGYKRIHELVSECLYVFVHVRKSLSQMILTVCREKMHKRIHALIDLGADVNINQNGETPLRIAVGNADEELVIYLLKSNITDLQTPLKLSKEKGHSRITGLLLNKMYYEQRSGSLMWSNQGLSDLNPDIFYPAFGLNSHPLDGSEQGMNLASSIRKGGEKREKRMSSASREPEKLLWRYQHSSANEYNNSRRRRLFETEEQVFVNQEASPSNQRKTLMGSVRDLGRRFSKPEESIKYELKIDITKVRRASLQIDDAKNLMENLAKEQTPADLDDTDYLDESRPSFASVASIDEKEHYQYTFSGGNVPYHRLDPRAGTEVEDNTTSPLPPFQIWERKGVSPARIASPPMLTRHSSPAISLQQKVELKKKSHSLSYSIRPSIRKRSQVLFGIQEPTDGMDEGPVFCDDTKMPSLSSSKIIHRNMRRSSSVGNCSEATTQEIKYLDLAENGIETLQPLIASGPTLLTRFGFLEKLDLSHNKLYAFPEDFYEYLQNIERLDLKDNFLTKFPVKLIYCKKLRIIDVSDNRISDITQPFLKDSFSVRELNISHNQLEKFPTWVQHFLGLETLNVSHNKLGSVLKTALQLKKLKILDLTENEIEEIPEEFLKETSNLDTLIASCNGLKKLPSPDIASKLTKLTTLKLAHNDLSEDDQLFHIPKFILALECLRTVELNNNRIKGFPPPTMWRTSMLRDLNLAHNKIDKIDLGKDPKIWDELECLVLSHNNIKEIPPDIGHLISLSSFNVDNNIGIKTLPDQMGTLKKLFEFPRKGLTINNIPQAVLKGTTKALITFLNNRLKKAVEHYRMKMMVVGYMGRGKSTLIRALRKEAHPDTSVSTIGIEVKDWILDTGERDKKNTIKYTLSIWDFAGQEEFYSTHQCFLSNRSLYVVVFDLSKGIEEVGCLKLWLLNIYAHAPNCPIIIVGTHRDKVEKGDQERVIGSFRNKIEDLCSKPGFPDICEIVEVDCTHENRDVSKLRNKIRKTIKEFRTNRNQPVMGMMIPASYLKLEELICAEKKHLKIPVLKRARMTDIAGNAKLDLNEEELTDAINFLHDTGVLLHYDDTTTLRDLYFIDPQWLGRMMAQVVTVDQISTFVTEEGILNKKHCSLLFTGKTVHTPGSNRPYSFPPCYIDQYLRLLEKFEIALPQNPEEWLIPCRLPKDKPERDISKALQKIKQEASSSLLVAGQVHRQYRLPYTPLGFWSRLITRLLVFVKTMLSEQSKLKEPEKRFWREGMFVHWSHDAYFLIEPIMDGDIIQITVPSKRRGFRLLGDLVDHVDTLIEEWYPGLLIKSYTGSELIERRVPCTCQSDGDRYYFNLDELINVSEIEKEVECPEHKTKLKLSSLAPDVVLADLDQKYQIMNESDLVFSKTAGNLLGNGGFGDVYLAKLRGRDVAVKVFNMIGGTHPHALMRQEATILRRLQHPSLLSMEGISLSPNRVIVLELAREGSLGSKLLDGSTSWLSRALTHRIALQIAEGLAYLHHYHIIYRDMKPDNILLFSLSLQAEINAKISDYGISRFSQHNGLKASEGTPGYKSPENIRQYPYTYVSDVFSYGMTLYEMVTGVHPYHRYTFRGERDDAVKRNAQRDPITANGCAPWPDMQDVIDYCLEYQADKRPSAADVADKIRGIDILSLKSSHFVCQNMTLECMAIRTYDEGVEVWIGSGSGKDTTQLSWLNLTTGSKVGGKVLKHSRILSMLSLGSSSILVGSQSGQIWVYDAWKHEEKHCLLNRLSDAVLSMCHYKGSGSCDLVLVGLADGKLAMFETHNIQNDSDATPQILQLGNSPVKCISVFKNKVYTSCGADVCVLQPSSHLLNIERTLSFGQQSSQINNLIASKKIYVSRRNGENIEVLHSQSGHVIKSLSLPDIIRDFKRKVSGRPHIQGTNHRDDILDPKRESKISTPEAARKLAPVIDISHQITSMMMPKPGILWVGTRGGHVVVVDLQNWTGLAVLHRHEAGVRSLSSCTSRERDKSSLILSGGQGFRPLCLNSTDKTDGNNGHVLVWDFETDQHARNQEVYLSQRESYLLSSTM